MQEMWVQSLGQEDALKKEIATHSSIFAWEFLWSGEPGVVAKSQTQLKRLSSSSSSRMLIYGASLVVQW